MADYKEVIENLRLCAKGDCKKCSFAKTYGGMCQETMMNECADTIVALYNNYCEVNIEMQRQMCRADGGVWVDVSKKLPDESGEYIVFLQDKDEPDELFKMSDLATCAEYDSEQKIFSWGDSWHWNMLLERPYSGGYTLTHWMKLPDPPKGA